MPDTYLEIVEEIESVTDDGDDAVTVIVTETPVVVVVDGGHDVVVSTEVAVEAVSVGTQGPPGPPGVDGVGAGNYYHMQGAVSNVWVVAHNLGYKPNVTAFNSADTQVEGDPFHDSVNQLTITFTSAFSGYALVS